MIDSKDQIPDLIKQLFPLIRELNQSEHELTRGALRRIEDIGRAHEILEECLERDIFDQLSKHNPYWHSQHEEEADRLDEVRMTLGAIKDDLYEIYEILHNEHD